MAINRLLTEKDREFLKPVINLMWKLCPNTMKRKIERANVQQAFVFDTVIDFYKEGNSILSAGCYDDTAYESLVEYGYDIVGIDPATNIDLHTYVILNEENLGSFDIVFSTSVIEHVENDKQFLEDIVLLLKKGGIGILTMDFNNDYKVGDKLPYSDLRFYTRDGLDKFTDIITSMGCELVDTPDWDGEPEFTHDGCNYSFATFVFRKKVNV